MSLAQYASPYNNESEVDNTNQKNQGGKKISAATASSLSSSSLRKTIKRPLQQQQQSQPSQPQSRVSDFMNKLNSQSTTTTTYIGDDDNGGGGDGTYGESDDLADYNPTTTADQHQRQQQQQQQQQRQQQSSPSNDDNVVTKENFMDLPSSYAKQYYQQYIPHYNKSASPETMALDAPKDELLEKMNHIIQMLEDQQDEKTGNVTEELILYCFLGVFVIFVVDSFSRAGKYVR